MGTHNLQKVNSLATFEKVLRLRSDVYGKQYPAIDFTSCDFFDFYACIWAGEDDQGSVISTSRLVLDSSCGLPSEKYIDTSIADYRSKGLVMAELGRLINTDRASYRNVGMHFKAAYLEAIKNHIDVIIMVTSAHKRSFYAKRLGAKVLCDDIGENFGSADIFSIYAWHIAETDKRFFKWVGIEKDKIREEVAA